MTRTLARTIFSLLQTLLLAALLASVFATTPAFFQSLLSAKQWFLELGVLLTAVFMAVSLPFIQDIRINAADAGVFLLASWFVVSNFLINTADHRSQNEVMFQVILWLTAYLFVRIGSWITGKWFHWSLVGVLLTIALLQSMLGLLQLYGFEASYHGLFNITGTFHNPGPFSGFVVSALPLAIVGCTERHERATETHREISFRGINMNPQKIFRLVLKAVSLLTIIAVLLVVAAQSRAAWVAGLIGSMYIVWSCRERFPFINRLSVRYNRLSKTLRALFIAGSIIFILGAATGIYLLKKDSANGRLLIWQVTSQLIKERPVTGYGSGAFTALYMDEQAKWFKSGKGSDEQVMIAGSPESPFNEPLKLWLEQGLIGLLLAGGILGIIFFPKAFNTKQETINKKLSTRDPKLETQNLIPGFKGALLSLLTFSLFSYPFDISSFTLQLVVLVALMSSSTPSLTTIKGRRSVLLTMPVAVLLIAAGVWYFPQRQAHYAALKTWKEATRLYNMGSFDIAAEAYKEAFPSLKNNGLFLQMHGKALSMDEQHEKSNEILQEATKRFSSYILYNTIGDNHKALGNFKKAETAYKKSSNMVPGLLLPDYLLAKLYVKSDQNRKAKQTAKKILNSPVKVESSATREIMNEMQGIVKHSTT